MYVYTYLKVPLRALLEIEIQYILHYHWYCIIHTVKDLLNQYNKSFSPSSLFSPFPPPTYLLLSLRSPTQLLFIITI